MPVFVDHDQYSIEEATFVLPAHLMESNPYEEAAAGLVSELARAGWDVDAFDIYIYASETGNEVVYKIGRIVFHSPDGEVTLAFGNHAGNGSPAYGVSGVSIEGILESSFYDDGSGKNRDTNSVKTALEAVGKAAAQAKALPSSPGYHGPSDDLNINRILLVEKVPAPPGMPKFYARVSADDALDLADGRLRALNAKGARLVPLGIRGDFNSKANDGFLYASLSPSVIPQHVVHKSSGDAFPVEISPAFLNDLYVVDNAVWDRARAATFAAAHLEGRQEASPAEVAGWYFAIASTMVPWSDYNGNYENPMVIIGRRLASDELRVICGPVRVRREGEGIVTEIEDTPTGNIHTLYRSGRSGYPQCTQAIDRGKSVVEVIGCEMTVGSEVKNAVEEFESNLPQLSAMLGI